MEDKRQLECVVFEIKPRNKSIDIFNLNLIKTLHKKFPDFVHLLPNDDNLKNSVKFEKKLSKKKNLKTTISRTKGSQFLSGKLSSTKYGYKDKIIDTEDKDADPVYITKEKDGVEKLFYFLIYFDRENNRGMIYTERVNVYGIKNIFSSLLKSFFKEYFPEYIFKLSSFIDKTLYDRVIDKGQPKSIHLKTYKPSAETSDKLKILKEETKDYELELIIRKKGGGILSFNTNKVIQKLFRESDKSYLIGDELKTLGFSEKSPIKVEYIFENKKKNINFDKSYKRLRTIYDIMVLVDVYGVSDFKSINKIAIEKMINLCPFYNEI